MIVDQSRSMIVTGAAGGIGRGVALRLLREGYDVTGVDLDPTVSELDAGAGGGAYVGVVGDVTDPGVAAAVVGDATGRGRLHGLVNAAGVHAAGTVADVDDEQWARVLGINLTAPMVWCRAVVPALVEAGGGAIVNVASVAGGRARPGQVAYAASKGGLVALSRSVAVDFGPHGVRCTSISPGPVETPLLLAAQATGTTSREEQLAASYLRRLGTVEEIAGCCAFLLSDDAGYLTGHDLVVDGARSAGI